MNVESYVWELVQQKVLNQFTETDRLSFFQTLHLCFQRIAQAKGTIDRFYSIGGYTIRLSFGSDLVATQLTPAISHLETNPTEYPALTICLWDNATTKTQLPGLMPAFIRIFQWYWHEYLDGRMNVKALCSDRFQMHFKMGPNIFSALDFQQNLALYWIDDATLLPYWERGSPLQNILSWWTSRQQRQYVHAAAVGTATGGVLLAAKGGSGKSTSALSCLNSSLTYASDDYCLISTDPIPYVYSLYNTAKLKGAKDLERFPELTPLITNGDRLHEEKALIFLNQHFPEKVVSGFPLRAILVPKITGERDTRLSKSTAIAALKALAPSTLFQLSGTGESSFQMMSQVVKQLPCFTLELGTDISQIPQVILEFLNASETSFGSLSTVHSR
ncbi:serine kinase [Merismopedia glauca CCAP 1448/3]|uniref:Serine kinase n=1 Tax=Merismopedia glauca CCAP 1448/3 TaxID=1296344 RepID=A0A2T1C073_9CYAN|nr:serine kinase [Merismopedia glauca CCAP 1448/3]